MARPGVPPHSASYGGGMRRMGSGMKRRQSTFVSSRVPTDPLAPQVLSLFTYWEPRLQPGQGRQPAGLGLKPRLFEMENKTKQNKTCRMLFL